MMQQAAGYQDCDIPLDSRDAPDAAVGCRGCASGGMRARSVGEPVRLRPPCRTARHGTLQLVAVDLRGRGRSEVTGAGTYGWRSHARDVLGVANAVGGRHLRSSASPAVRPSPWPCAARAVAHRAAGTGRSGGQS